MHRRAALASVLALAATPLRAQERRALSPAQVALFETPHLLALSVPIRLDYAFRREETGHDPVEDRIRLEIRAGREPQRRDVEVEFLTGPRAIRYPPALGFRGNPLLLFALDRDARELAAATGGSMQWFRTRLRRGFETAEIRPCEVELDGQRIEAREILLEPFGGEPRAGRYQARRYGFVLADAVPGTIQAIRSLVPADEAGGAIAESIVFAGATQPEAAP